MNDSAHSEEQLLGVAAELATNASLELSLGEIRVLGEAAELLPRGTSVYVPSPVQRPFGSDRASVGQVWEAGFEPVPHLPARSIPSRSALQQFLRDGVARHGVRRVMLIGGDRHEPLGPYPDSAAVLEEGVLVEAGIHEVAVAGYPEGHPGIPAPALDHDLARKMELAERQGLGLEIVSQFSFSPSRVVEYCARMARMAPEIPVYVGMAGPASFDTLRRFARHCGVSASLRALRRFGATAAETATHTDPAEQMIALAHFCAARDACNVIGVHLFSFGGFLQTARWMRSQCRPD
jgi:methylenetetrahydrofolate reductase (NADPH)